MWSYTEEETVWLGTMLDGRPTRQIAIAATPPAHADAIDLRRLVEDPDGPCVWPSQHFARRAKAGGSGPGRGD